MSEERAEYNAGQQPVPLDEYQTRPLGTGEFEVYRVVGSEPGRTEVHYCECKTIDTATIIARALNFIAALDGRIVETISYNDGELLLIIRGDEAERAYLRALPVLRED